LPAGRLLGEWEGKSVQFADISHDLNWDTLVAILEQAPVGLALIDTRMRFTQVNNPFADIVSIPSYKLSGRCVNSALSEKIGAVQAENLTAIAKRILATGGVYTASTWETPNSSRYLEWTLKRLEVDEVSIGLLLTVADVTRHIQLQKELENYQQQLSLLVAERTAELRRANERFYTAFNVTPSLMCIHDRQGRIIDFSSSFLKVTGWKKEEVVGRTLLELDICTPEVIKPLARQFCKKGYIRNQELSFNTKDGQRRFAIVSAEEIMIEGKRHIMGMATDVTDVRVMKSELVRLDRLNLVGQMAAGISHEVRNPMTTVRGFLQMLSKKEECKLYQDYFDLMISELDRANLILTEFLSVARPTPACQVESDLNAVIKAIEPLMTTDAVIAGNDIELQLGTIKPLCLNEKEIRQLLLNLVRNGFEAMTNPGVVTIRTYEENGQVVLAVQDEGPGISPQVLAKLGTPFITSKHNGTGLGLAVCYGIVERHKGKIEVATGADGTTFYIRFNAIEKTSLPRP
jgi:two-component system, sporulation sensor kinase E